ncbi:MAG: T9SS type A sorting domain-containing protein [Candidatus Marinimicrobia bacterium]|nr:T9SS type A sorting domain-containing protein [Candidatus Neomarinimicrobiota bacterium]
MIYIIEDLLAGESLQTDEIKIIPAHLTLYPAYPNPFNPLTQIQYDLPEQTHVSLVIYDLLGREIRMLVNKIQRPGRYMIHWDGSNSAGMLVASGMYIYQLQSQNFITTKKIIYLK